MTGVKIVVAGVALCVAVIPLALLGGGASASCGGTTTSVDVVPDGDAAGFPKLWSGKVQRTNAAIVVATGRRLKVPPYGWTIAVATAMQESTLRNLANANVPASLRLPHQGVGRDHDSVGVFQQRPLPPDGAGSWGTVKELMTVEIAAAKFYRALLRVPGWQNMELTRAAQTVQRSAFPSAYAKWEDDAKQVVAATLKLPNLDSIGGGGPHAPCGTEALGDVPVSAEGWTAPVDAPITSPFGRRWGRLHAGVDLGSKRGDPIRAAAGGKVVFAGCSPSTGNCDVDGSLQTPGYGWYVEIWHQGNVVTRYGHMVKRPQVRTGQIVKPGTVIGFAGTSGHSTAVHLHFEVHTNVPLGGAAHNGNAIDPVPFMEKVRAPLGVSRRQ